MAMFTMEEFIKEHKLGVSVSDPQVTRMIAKTLRAKGFKQVRITYKGTPRQNVWTNERTAQLGELKSKLASLKL